MVRLINLQLYYLNVMGRKFGTSKCIGFCSCSMFCCALLYVHSRIALILMGEYDHVRPQSQNVDKPMAPRERANNNHETLGRQTKQNNQLSLPHQDDCKTSIGHKVSNKKT